MAKKKPAAAAPEAKAEVPAVETIVSYKGFDRQWQCRGYQFAVGQTYVHDGDVKACAGGFHACEYPLDVLSYYAPGESRYAVVEQSGDLSRHADDTKVASRSITVKAEIDIAGLVRAAIEWTTKRCLPIDPASPALAAGNRGAASATGNRGAASATGYSGAASATGDSGAASATGDGGAASATGDGGAASATGKHGCAAAFGWGCRAMAGETGAIFLVHRDEEGAITRVFASRVGDNGIKAGVWYELGSDGTPVEAA